MHPHRFAHRTLRTLLACLLLVPLSGTAALEDKLVIVTSFPEDLTGPFQAAFESKYPQVKVEVLNKKTSAGVKYIQETAANNTSDLFWVSAPDAFGVLKGRGLLQKYQPKSEGIPDMIGSFPINDPDGHFFGFAASGYGIMYNTRYLKAKKLPVPKEWDDLKKPIYFGHVGMSAPSRSGTTHLTVEALLQGEGWDKGWASMKEMGGNFSTVTERSFGVPDGVNSGEFGIGIVIDFFGFSSRASGFPVDFVYPTITALVPANVGIIKNAPHPNAAAAFIDYLLSDEGQEILFDKKIQRLPVKPAIYAKAPEGLPNPFKDKSIGAAVKFDSDLSEGRYNLVNSLFDQLITFRMDELRAATGAIHEATAALAKKPNKEGQKLLDQARQHLGAIPVSESEASNPNFVAIFQKKRKKSTDTVPERQAEVEQRWDAFARENYTKAEQLAKQAASMAR
ncbi:MAG: extracellular solute-binding protein [Proteobacteria bacterium]|nr:MAG: extracellular solute-binding protein [Pseudomonadota bacterium]QKK11791.1 MAG: extracellular solute-binding protein [Pseudomonadota bacterium]